MNRKQIKKNVWKTIIASAVIGLIIVLQFSGNPVQKACATKDTIDKTLVNSVLRIEEVHHADHGEFLKSILDIEKYYPESMHDLNYLHSQIPSNKWDLNLYSQNYTLVVFAIAKSSRYQRYSLHSSVGILKFDSSRKRYAVKHCRSDQPGSITVNQSVAQQSYRFSCPIGTHENC